MADFCRQCSFDIFGEDNGDMKGISTAEDTAQQKYALVLCEDCGPCYVDHEGVCVDPTCFKKHGEKKV